MGAWNIPADCKYTKTDEWIKLDGDEALVGITDYAQDQLSDIVFVEMPEAGEHFPAGAPFAVVESVKAAADINMPVDGEIVTTNTALEDTPELINEEPYGKGWIIRIKPSEPSEIGGLMDSAVYTDYCNERE